MGLLVIAEDPLKVAALLYLPPDDVRVALEATGLLLGAV